jgi:hypothetical protein
MLAYIQSFMCLSSSLSWGRLSLLFLDYHLWMPLGHLAPQPAKILETRIIKKMRLPVVTEVLVQWEGGDQDNATWELLFKLQEDYPHLVGKVF